MEKKILISRGTAFWGTRWPGKFLEIPTPAGMGPLSEFGHHSFKRIAHTNRTNGSPPTRRSSWMSALAGLTLRTGMTTLFFWEWVKNKSKDFRSPAPVT
jgi:hypothetical protein